MDQALFNLIHNLSGRFWPLDWVMIFFAQYLPYLLCALFVYLVFASAKSSARFYFLLLSALSLLIARGLVTETMRFFYPRLRPFIVLNFEPLIAPISSASFPSGHAVIFFALALLAFYVNKKWFWYFGAGALAIGLARIYVGVHWPSDILAGALLAGLVVMVTRRLLPRT